MDIKAVCFDIDGTMYPLWMTKLALVPTFFPSISLIRSIQRFRNFMREEGIKETEPPNKRGFINRQTLFVQQKINKSVSVDLLEKKIDEQFYKRMESSFSYIRSYPYLRETIKLIREKNIIIGALSDFPIQNKLENLHINDLVDYAACTEESGYLKPHKAPFEYMGRIMGVPLKNILYIGDSYKKDIIGANRVGMQTCLLLVHTHGKNKKENYKHTFPLADFICSDYLDMKRQLHEFIS